METQMTGCTLFQMHDGICYGILHRPSSKRQFKNVLKQRAIQESHAIW